MKNGSDRASFVMRVTASVGACVALLGACTEGVEDGAGGTASVNGAAQVGVTTGAGEQAAAGVTSGAGVTTGTGGPTPQQKFAMIQTNLVADQPAANVLNVDPILQNAWGIAIDADPEGALFWVAANKTGMAPAYDRLGKRQEIAQMPDLDGETASPTGLIYHDGIAFFGDELIADTEDGRILGLAEDGEKFETRAACPDAIYKGLAVATIGTNEMLLAANFFAGRIDVYDSSYNMADPSLGLFVDPNMQRDYAPFNVAVLRERVYVSYALQDDDKEDDVAGPGNGFVSVFGMDGTFIERFTTGGALNSPWAMMLTPKSFGEMADKLLIGNFGDGRMHLYDPGTHLMVETLIGADGYDLYIPGLWDVKTGPVTRDYDASNSLYFSAGPADEEHGLFGRLDRVLVTLP